MLKSLGVQLLKPRFSPRFLIRNFSADSNTPGNKKSDIAASAEIKESMQEQIDRLISPAASSGPGKVYENSEYSRVYFPKTTYHPHELDEGYAQKAMEKAAESKKSKDPFVALGLNPLKAYKNSSLLSNFVTDMGKIKPRYKTGLTPKSQRRVAQAIKRARAFGLIPVTSRLDSVNNYKSLGRGGR
ncbi:hypothetical protein GGI03_002952 [Coemansia sp. RSA 2337]|nr:hypothetical protein GGI14_003619 [Coemansia sp. S680]KAJ2023986.1 hypothetical protein H4S03_009211 [Coemansia sp. S3946]KAJ2097281.1 hypothetical protein GGI09_003914 [Coemansia sp. S100]KAJ2102211.1 hypothetical protein IW146_009153 [Coemansia sp. RSA 922]KAJ2415859.1 hypothetical protein GGF41_005574 [Coemansia sp. RSA 2531]KAJ2464924.1 hypothetical protein GGI03_002952 [Coemansia sp. RSA 2337]